MDGGEAAPQPGTPHGATNACHASSLGAVLLRTDPALAFSGRLAVPARLIESSFRFEYPDLDEALTALSVGRGRLNVAIVLLPIVDQC